MQDWGARHESGERKRYIRRKRQNRLHISDSWQAFLFLFSSPPSFLFLHHGCVNSAFTVAHLIWLLCWEKVFFSLSSTPLICIEVFPTSLCCHTAGLSGLLCNSKMEIFQGGLFSLVGGENGRFYLFCLFLVSFFFLTAYTLVISSHLFTFPFYRGRSCRDKNHLKKKTYKK